MSTVVPPLRHDAKAAHRCVQGDGILENGEQYMELPSAESSAEVIDVDWSGIACLGGMGERFFKPFLTLIRYDKKQNPPKNLRFSPPGGAGSKGFVRNATGSSFVRLETEYHVAVQGTMDNRLFPLIRRSPENSRLPAPVIRRFSNCASSSRGKRSNRAAS